MEEDLDKVVTEPGTCIVHSCMKKVYGIAIRRLWGEQDVTHRVQEAKGK